MNAKKTSAALDRQQVATETDKLLFAFCDAKIAEARKYDRAYEDMWKRISTYLRAGGKRIRPYLTVLSYGAYGGQTVTDILPAACAWELLHAGLLIHDDIIDRDIVRHGSPNVAGMFLDKYGPDQKDSLHFANSAALLAGSLLLSGAQEMVIASSLSADHKLLVCRQLNDALFRAAGGELLDIESVLQPVADSSPEKIAYNKTAGYSFELPIICGASLAGAPESDLKHLQKFGEKIGILYQLIDDILGVFGATNETGKPNDSDIREKKRTALIKQTIDNLSGEERPELEKLFNHSHTLTVDDVRRVRQLIEQTDAKRLVYQRATLLADESRDIVVQLAISDTSKQQLEVLIDKLLVRLS